MKSKQCSKKSLDSYESEVLDMKFDFGNGVEEHIMIRIDDNAEDIINTLCTKHKLKPNQKALLTEQIKKILMDQFNENEGNIYDESISENIEEAKITNRIPVLNIRMSNSTNSNIKVNALSSARVRKKVITTKHAVNNNYKKEFDNVLNKKNACKHKVQQRNKQIVRSKLNAKNLVECRQISANRKAKSQERIIKTWEAQHPFHPFIYKE